MGNNRNNVAIVIINWNSYQDIYECIRSLEKSIYKKFEVFIVDNNSADNSYSMLKSAYSNNEFNLDITFIQSGDNLGFAGGNNVGIKEASEKDFEYIWMLNNDTIVDEYALEKLVSGIESDDSIGIVGSKILYYGTDKIWFAGGTVSKWSGRTDHIGMKKRDGDQYNEERYVDYISGCSLLFRKGLIDSIGYMTEDYFLYFEETDWNIRATKNKWKIKYIPSSIVHHKVSISSGGEDNPLMNYYIIRNGFVMAKRNYKKSLLILPFIMMCWIVFKKHVKIVIKNQDRKFIRSQYLLRGMKDAIISNMGKI